MTQLLLLLLAALGLEAAPTRAEIAQAIRHLAPAHVPARRLARIVAEEAPRWGIHPFMAVAFIHKESSWNPKLVSSTNDYGLTQVHVNPRGSERFLGREHELFDPRTNIREWVRLAAMWRAHHDRSCDAKAHFWWEHLKWGYEIRAVERPQKVLGLFRDLLWRRWLRRLQPLMSSSQTS